MTIRFDRLFSASILGFALAGCSGAGQSPGGSSEIVHGDSNRSAATGISSASKNGLSYEIYVTNSNSNELTTYKAHGERTDPTIDGLSNPQSVAVDSTGKIYVANLGNGTVTTYNPNGSQTSPTISGLRQPIGIAVDANGKIYVTERAANRLTTYNADGSASKPTIHHLDKPGGVAVSSSGLIYIASTGGNRVTRYEPDGTQTTPTITNLVSPVGIALGDDDYLLYVIEGGVMTVYEASTGASAGPAIRGLNGDFVATSPGTKSRSRKIFIPNTESGKVNAYNAGNGFPSEPNITMGLSGPNGIAVH